MNHHFKAMVVSETEANTFKMEIIKKQLKDLPEGDLLINVKYSSLNYKDALSSIGNKGVTRNYPHTPGIDAAGIVVTSNNTKFKVNDQVIITGYDLGMNTSGGFAQYIQIPSKWAIKLPNTISLKESMIYGTAGFTAALSVDKLINSGIKPADGTILVTGATGGVGSMAVSILSKLNYEVIAATGKLKQKEMLNDLGAKEVINRKDLSEISNRPLLKEKWAGVIDTVGGEILSNAIKATNYGGTITCCGNIASEELSTSIYPFILRGISLHGIDSVQSKPKHRERIWNLLANEWKIDAIEKKAKEVSLNNLEDKIQLMLDGNHIGRTIINLDL